MLIVVALLLASLQPGRLVAIDIVEDDVVVEEGPDAFGGGVMSEDTFDQVVFNGDGAGGRGGTERFRIRMLRLAQAHVDGVDRSCDLSEPQKQKLKLAAKGDVVRFCDRVEQARAKFMRDRLDRIKMQQIWQELQPLQLAVARDSFGKGTIFYKTMQGVLSEAQIAKYEAYTRERRLFQYRAYIASALAYLEVGVPLESQQRSQLAELIENETPLPRDFGRYGLYVALYGATRIPDEKLKLVLDVPQHKAWSRRLQQYRQVGQWLKQQGLIGDETDDKARDDKARAAR